MKKIGVMIAMDKEFQFFASHLQNLNQQILHKCKFYTGIMDGKEITAVISGIGKVNTALCAADLINIFNVDMIINIGISGGLDSSLNIGDFVVGNEIVYHDVWCGEPNKTGQVQGLPESYYTDSHLTSLLPQFRHGLLCCGDQFITEEKELKPIIEKFPQALAVDMESAAIAQTCYLYNIPFLCIRQISDVAGHTNQQEQYQTFWKNAADNSVAVLKDILEKL